MVISSKMNGITISPRLIHCAKQSAFVLAYFHSMTIDYEFQLTSGVDTLYRVHFTDIDPFVRFYDDAVIFHF